MSCMGGKGSNAIHGRCNLYEASFTRVYNQCVSVCACSFTRVYNQCVSVCACACVLACVCRARYRVTWGMTALLREQITYLLNNRRFHYKYFTIPFSCRSTIDLLEQFSGCSFQTNTTSILLRVQQKPSYPRHGARRPPDLYNFDEQLYILRTMSSNSKLNSRVHH